MDLYSTKSEDLVWKSHWILSEGLIRPRWVVILSHYNMSIPFNQQADNRLCLSSAHTVHSFSVLFVTFSSFSQHNQTISPSLPLPPPSLLSQYDNTIFSSLLSSSALFTLKVEMSFECKHFSVLATKAEEASFFLLVLGTGEWEGRFIAAPLSWIEQKRPISAKPAVFQIPVTLSLSASGSSSVMN